jgi:hypothetical protein
MDDAADGSLLAELVIRAGGWHPDYARVLLIEPGGAFALVLVDGNGDGAELELEYWYRDAGGIWEGGSSSGHGALDWLPAASTWSTGDFVCALGRAETPSVVSIGYGGTTYSRQANEFGLWGFVHDADSSRPDDLPTVTAAH